MAKSLGETMDLAIYENLIYALVDVNESLATKGLQMLGTNERNSDV